MEQENERGPSISTWLYSEKRGVDDIVVKVAQSIYQCDPTKTIVEMLEEFRSTVRSKDQLIESNILTKENFENARYNIFVELLVFDYLFHNEKYVKEYMVSSVLDFVKHFEIMFPSYFKDPASSKFHGDYEGGLIDHSFAVVEAMLKSYKAYFFDTNMTDNEFIGNLSIVACLMHDLCKVGNYKIVTKNKKVDNKWVNYEAYETNQDNVIIQHGPESLMRYSQLMLNCVCDCGAISEWLDKSVTKGWKHAISWHMGVYNVNPTFDMGDFNRAMLTYPEILLMHHSDMIASKVYGI